MEQHKQVVRRFIEQVLNAGDIDATGQFFWEDMIELVPFPGQGPGIDGLKTVLRGMRQAFADMHWTIHEQIAEDDKVVTRFEWTGTHGGTFMGIAATGRSVRVWGIVIDQLVAGRIKTSRMLTDTVGLMTQLGQLPPR